MFRHGHHTTAPQALPRTLVKLWLCRRELANPTDTGTNPPHSIAIANMANEVSLNRSTASHRRPCPHRGPDPTMMSPDRRQLWPSTILRSFYGSEAAVYVPPSLPYKQCLLTKARLVGPSDFLHRTGAAAIHGLPGPTHPRRTHPSIPLSRQGRHRTGNSDDTHGDAEGADAMEHQVPWPTSPREDGWNSDDP